MCNIFALFAKTPQPILTPKTTPSACSCDYYYDYQEDDKIKCAVCSSDQNEFASAFPDFRIDFQSFPATFSRMDLVHSQVAQYIPVLILLAAAVGFAGGVLAVSVLLGKVGKRTKAKDTAYECGLNPIGEGAARFSVKFYLVAMLFILFDIEVVFLYPWAVVYKEMLAEHATRNLIFGSMLSFIVILFVGYLYALKKKAFDWRS